MELFQPDFSANNDTGSNGHGVANDSPHLDDQQQGGLDPKDADMDDAPLRGKAATQGLSVQEKKERQKQQNRRAAERSRNKKREELTALEMTVNNIQDENNRLRARLSSLLATKSSETAHQDPVEADAKPSGMDYAALAKLQDELVAAKATLLERELELGRAQSMETQGSDLDAMRQQLLAHTNNLQTVQSEVSALHSTINHLRTERDTLSRQREVLSREIEARRLLRESESPSLPSNSRAAGVERALLELRGLVDGVIKTWEQGGIIPRTDAPEGEQQ